MNRTSLKYGLMAGILLTVLSWISFYLTRSSGVALTQIASIVVILLALGFVPAAIHNMRKQNNEFISFWKAFFTGALTSTVPAFFMFASTIVFMIVQRSQYAEWSVSGNSQGITNDTVAVIMNPFEQGIIMFLIVMMLGTLISLVSAMILHRTQTSR